MVYSLPRSCFVGTQVVAIEQKLAAAEAALSDAQRSHLNQMSNAKREFDSQLLRLKEQNERKLRVQQKDYEEIMMAEKDVSIRFYVVV